MAAPVSESGLGVLQEELNDLIASIESHSSSSGREASCTNGSIKPSQEGGPTSAAVASTADLLKRASLNEVISITRLRTDDLHDATALTTEVALQQLPGCLKSCLQFC